MMCRTGGPPSSAPWPAPIRREVLRAGRHGIRADSSKAIRELGFHPRPVQEALRETMEWLQRQKETGV